MGSSKFDVPDRLVDERERRAITSISRSSWWDGEKAGRYPRRVRIGPRRVGWRLHTLLAFLDSLERDGAERAAQ